jgi:hypothetical protein
LASPLGGLEAIKLESLKAWKLESAKLKADRVKDKD